MPTSKFTQSRKAKSSDAPTKKSPDVVKCTKCKRVFNKIQHVKEFSTVKSSLWEGNGFKIPICNECLVDLYNFYKRNLGSEYAAFRRICMKFDAYYNKDIVDSILNNESGSDKITPYFSQLNFARYVGKTYDNTIEEEQSEQIRIEDEEGNELDIREEYEKLKTETATLNNKIEDLNAKADAEPETDPVLDEMFGLGFSAKEQGIMLKFYNSQREQIPQQLLITLDETVKDMARFKVLQGRAISINELGEISKYSDLFNKSRKYIDDTIAKYKKNAAADEGSILLGTLTEAIEQFCPATVYAKPKLFDDIDGAKGILARLIGRPMKNFFTGSRELDPEFNIENFKGGGE